MDTNTDNTDTKALFIEAKRLYDAREYVQALPKLQSLLEHEPDNVPALIWSADILCEFRHWEKSLSVAQHALAIEPKNPLLLSLMSKVLHHLSDFDGSVRYAKRADKPCRPQMLCLRPYVHERFRSNCQNRAAPVGDQRHRGRQHRRCRVPIYQQNP
ncbi:MAG: tetratricopeptide repeat protein [Helicobacter sp.]|nr:tetratricopeptide repeat protein [Helicobacter sp.]